MRSTSARWRTSDFYGGFMSPLDLEGLNLLLNAGLNQELVLHSVIEAFRVRLDRPVAAVRRTTPRTTFPGDGVRAVARTAPAYDGTENAFEPVSQRGIWRDPRADCRYQKFLYFMRVAVRWGVTVEAPRPQAARAGGAKGKSRQDRRDRDRYPSRAQYFVCYDPAIARRTTCPLPGNQRAPADRRTGPHRPDARIAVPLPVQFADRGRGACRPLALRRVPVLRAPARERQGSARADQRAQPAQGSAPRGARC